MISERSELPGAMYNVVPANLEALLKRIDRLEKDGLMRGVELPVDLVAFRHSEGLTGDDDIGEPRRHRFRILREAWANFWSGLW